MASPGADAAVSFAEAQRRLGFDDPERFQPHAWDSSQVGYPGDPPSFLTDPVLRETLGWIGAGPEITTACLAAAAAIRGMPEACRFAWHVHQRMFEAPDGMKRFSVEAPALGEHAGMLPVLLTLSGVPRMRVRHRARAIPEAVTVHTLGDLGIWMRQYRERNGRWGLRELRWMMHHLKGDLVRLGRLQFKPSGLWPETGWEPDLAAGDPILEIHIPAEDPLEEAACVDSCRRAQEFFPRHFPDRPFKAITCVAWLLDPVLRDILPPDANLVRFQSHFRIHRVEADDATVFDRVFGRAKPADPATLPRRTGLQRAVADHYLRGGQPLAEGAGVWVDQP